jgi:hypothetical protein
VRINGAAETVMSQLKTSSPPKVKENLPGRCPNDRLACRMDLISRVIILDIFYAKMFISCSNIHSKTRLPVYQAFILTNLREKPGTDRAFSNITVQSCGLHQTIRLILIPSR